MRPETSVAVDRAVVCLATHSYGKHLIRLERSLDRVGFRGARVLWRPGEWPAGCPRHERVPWSFKPFCLAEARKRGHSAALWLDANTIVLRPLDSVFEQIERVGYVLFRNGNYRVGEWASDDALEVLGLTREEALALPEVNAAVVGMHFSQRVARLFLESWLAEAHRGIAFRGTAGAWDPAVFQALKWNVDGRASPDPRVRGHRSDQTVAGILADRLGMRLLTGGLEAPNRASDISPEAVIVKWRRPERLVGLRWRLMILRIRHALGSR